MADDDQSAMYQRGAEITRAIGGGSPVRGRERGDGVQEVTRSPS
jgi:hypothetical protein